MKKEIIRVGIVLFVVVGLVLFGLNFIFNQNAPKSKAAGETMYLSFNPASPAPTANQDFTVSLIAKPSINTVLRGYRTKINFDNTKLKFKSIQYKMGVVSAGLGNVTADVATVNNRGSVNLVAEDQTATGSTITAAKGANLATITFTAIGTSGNTVKVSNSVFFSINADKSLFHSWTIVAKNLSINGGDGTGTSGSCTSFADNFSGVPSTNSFADDFSEATVNQNNFNLWTDGNGTANIANGKVTIQLPASTDGKSRSADLDAWHRGSVGDFSVEVTSNSINGGANGGAAFLDIWGAIKSNSDGTNNNSGFDIRRDTNGHISTYVHIYQQSITNETQTVQLATPLTNSQSVKFKLERVGSTINMYYDIGNGYQLARTVNNFPALWIRSFFGVQNWGPNFPTVSGTFDDYKQTVGPQFNGNNWLFAADNYGSAVVSNNLATLFLPSITDGKPKGTYLTSKQVVGGDFTIEAELNSLSTVNNANTADLVMAFSHRIGDSAAETVQVSRQSSQSFIQSTINFGSLNWDAQNTNVGLSENTPIKVKIQRTGSTITTYYDILDGQGYKQARQLTNFYTGSGNIMLFIRNSSPNFPESSGVISNFALTCPATGGVTGDVKLNLKLKFQGIGAKPTTPGLDTMNVRVKLFDETTSTQTEYQTASFVSDANGIWSGEVTFANLNLAHKFAVITKGPLHLAKKICVTTPTETQGGTYHCSAGQINLIAGDNNLDFSGILQLGGDLPEQDGSVTAADISLIRNSLVNVSDEIKPKCDINRDNRCDTQDYSLVIGALSIKNDEE
jgi:hypothetical protein